jgi:interferon gamma-inducible protein 30
MAVATDNLRPAHTYVPWVVVNGNHASTTEQSIMRNMVKTVCDLYKGEVKIAACSK